MYDDRSYEKIYETWNETTEQWLEEACSATVIICAR